MKKIIFALAAIGLGIGVYVFLSNHQAQPASTRDIPPAEVGVISLHPETIHLTQRLNGRVVPHLIAEVRPQVRGIIQDRFFEEGGNVAKDAPLYRIDPAMYTAEQKQAEATLAHAKANRDAAAGRLARYEGLLNSRAVNRQEYEDVDAAFRIAEAEVELADAQLQAARINLERTVVTSPIGGRVGISNFTQGALVTDGQREPLTVVQQLDPIYVDVYQPIGWILDAREALRSGSAEIRLVLPNGKEYGHAGRIFFADAAVDQSTGTVNLRAEFPNPDLVLLPGMYVRAQLEVAEIADAITVPQRALFREGDGSAFVILAGSDDTAEKRPVVTGSVHENKWVIESGLRGDETLVVDGTQRLRFLAGGPAPRIKAVGAEPAGLAYAETSRQ